MPPTEGIAILTSHTTNTLSKIAIGLEQMFEKTNSEIPLRTAKSKNGKAGETD